jgi:hypothetical protein
MVRGIQRLDHREVVRSLFAVLVAAIATLGTPSSASAAVSPSYFFIGAEIWATHTVGTFAGDAVGSKGDFAAWQAAIEHTVQTIPEGKITGGYARLVTTDLTYVRGTFSGGRLWLIDDGAGSCGNLTHRVRGYLVKVRRSDTGAVGTGLLVGKLVHYRVSVFGQCIPYSATAQGTIYLYW